MKRRFTSFADFYPFYLSQHRNPICRNLHVCGLLLAVLAALLIVVGGRWQAWWLIPTLGYGLSWIGHVVFEKNRPATFRHPIYSLLGDLVMTVQTLRRWRGR
jgi:hypothetical protein